MKKFILATLLVLSQTGILFAQKDSVTTSAGNTDGEIKTLFKKSDHHAKIGYFISPEFAWTQFDGRNVYLGGLSLGVIVDHWFSAGLAGSLIMNSHNLLYTFDVPLDTPNQAYLYGGYGGFKFEFRVLPKSPVHINFPLLIGGGGLVYNTWTHMNGSGNYAYNYNGTTLDWDAFFVVEPGAMVEVNMLKFMRFDAGISYRYTPDLKLIQTSAGLINNFNANVSLKFGKF